MSAEPDPDRRRIPVPPVHWFYSLKGRQTGPVDTADLTRLAATGVVQPDTFVWREGMADWEPYSRVELNPQGGTRGDTACSQCRKLFPTDELVALAGGPTCAACKPLVLERLREGVSGDAGAVSVRTKHLRHEASIRTVGTLYTIVGWFLIVIQCSLVAIYSSRSSPTRFKGIGPNELILLSVYALFLFLVIWTGQRLRGLDAKARVPATLLSCLGFAAFLFVAWATRFDLFGILLDSFIPLISGHILYLIHSAKGQFILSPEYQAIVAATPGIRCRTSVVVWGVLALLAAFIVLGVVSEGQLRR